MSQPSVPVRTAADAAPRADNVGRGIALTLVTMLIFASQDAITKQLGGSLHAAQIVLVRYIAFAVVAAIVIGRKPGGIGRALQAHRPWLQIGRSLLLVIEIGIFAFAVSHMKLSAAQAIFASCPLIVTALSPLVLGEEVSLRRWAAVAAGFAGVLLIIRPGASVFDPTSLMALAGALMFAVYTLLTRMTSRQDSFDTSYIYLAWFGLLGVLVPGLLVWQWPTLAQWGWLLILSATSITSHLLLMKALALAPASVLQPFNYTQLLWGTVIGMAIFREFPSVWTLGGALVVAAAGIAAARLR